MGGGHDGAAFELARRLRTRGYDVEVRDFLQAWPRLVARIVKTSYLFQLKVAPSCPPPMLADTMRTRRPVADSAITSAGWAETGHAGTDCRDRVKDQAQNATVVQHGMHRGPRDAPQLRPRRRATCTIARPSTCVPGP